MEAVRPTKLIDPVCGMTVDVAAAEAGGLLLEDEGRTFAVGRSGCRLAFVEDPATYVAKAEAADVAADVAGTPEVADIGMMQTGSVTYTFTGSGPVAFACHAPGHHEAGMTGTIAIQ